MLNAVLVVIRPEIGWARVARREENFLVVALIEWMLLALVTMGFESWGMIELGAGKNSIGGAYNLSLVRILNYQIVYLLLFSLFVCVASVLIYFSVKKDIIQCGFYYLAGVVVYLSSPVLVMKILDAFPGVNTWVCFMMAMVLIVVSTYAAIPKILFPNVSDGFSIFILISLILCGMLFCCHFINVVKLKIG
jgi:hypothetical protein